MNTIGGRFDYARKQVGLSYKKLGELFGITGDAVRKSIERDNIKPNYINTFSDKYGIPKDWIEKAEGEFRYNLPKEVEDIAVNSVFEHEFSQNKNSNHFIKLPNGQWFMTMPLAEHGIQAGFLDHYQDLDFLTDIVQHSIIVDKPVQGRYVAFRVKGYSMDDGTKNAIEHNNIVSCRELQRQHWVDKLRTKDFPYWVIYTTQSKMPLLKQIVAHDTIEAKIKCHSLNDGPDYSLLLHFTDVCKSVSAIFLKVKKCLCNYY